MPISQFFRLRLISSVKQEIQQHVKGYKFFSIKTCAYTEFVFIDIQSEETIVVATDDEIANLSRRIIQIVDLVSVYGLRQQN